MLPLEHSAILLTCIEKLSVLKNNFRSFLRVAILHRFYFSTVLYHILILALPLELDFWPKRMAKVIKSCPALGYKSHVEG